MRSIVRRLALTFGLLLWVFLMGTTGYKILGGESVSWMDCAYMTGITVTTVGYTEVVQMGTVGRLYTLLLLLFGMGTALYCVSAITASVIEGQLQHLWQRRKMEKQIGELRNHFVVCGAGATGIHVIDELVKTQRKFVVIEQDETVAEGLRELGDIPYLAEDATDEDVLCRAGIARARALVVTLPSDKDNLFVVFCARQLNADMRIVAKAEDPKIGARIRKAGADAVVSPNFIGGLRMVSEMVRPTVVTFLDLMLRDVETNYRVEEVQVADGSPLVEKSVAKARVRERTGALVMAMRAPGEKDFAYNPDPKTEISAGSALVVLANVEQLAKLQGLAEKA